MDVRLLIRFAQNGHIFSQLGGMSGNLSHKWYSDSVRSSVQHEWGGGGAQLGLWLQVKDRHLSQEHLTRL